MDGSRNASPDVLNCPLDCFSEDFRKFDRRQYRGLTNCDVESRINAYNNLKNKICGLLDGVESPYHRRNGSHKVKKVTDIKMDSLTANHLRYHVQTLHCMSIQSPFDDVREHCSQLVAYIQHSGMTMDDILLVNDEMGPSSFIPLTEVVPVNSSNGETKVLFIEAYRQNNRLDHLTQIMGFHPQYLACFLRTQNKLLRADGPLPYTHRHYIAIIAAARHQCTYLVHLHTAEFLQAGGDRKWLECIDEVPVKLRNLQEINRFLAHRPWMVTKDTIKRLCQGDNRWSLSELTHAIVLLAHFHALCSAVFGCGVNFELDDSAGRLLHSDGESSGDSDTDSINCEQAAVDSLLQRLKTLKDEAEEYSEEEGRRRFETIESQTAECAVRGASGQTRSSSSSPSAADGRSNGHCVRGYSASPMNHLVEKPDFVYADFVKFKDTTPTFRASDYSWEAHGYSIANRLYPEMGDMLDDKFRTAQQFTYYTIGEKYTNVNTQDFRTGIWNYIHCIMGIRHDDYDYGRVNSLLEKGFKSFIKLMTCYPERVSKKDFEGIMRGFTYSEKIHVSIILLEARMQAELLYAFRAVSQFFT